MELIFKVYHFHTLSCILYYTEMSPLNSYTAWDWFILYLENTNLEWAIKILSLQKESTSAVAVLANLKDLSS